MANKTSEFLKNVRHIIYEKFDGRCAYCGCEISYSDFDIDHLVPKKRGNNYPENTVKGSDDIDNLMPSCNSCNLCKSDMSIEGFRNQVLSRVEKLDSFGPYRIAKRFGLVTEVEIDKLSFHFETVL